MKQSAYTLLIGVLILIRPVLAHGGHQTEPTNPYLPWLPLAGISLGLALLGGGLYHDYQYDERNQYADGAVVLGIVLVIMASGSFFVL